MEHICPLCQNAPAEIIQPAILRHKSDIVLLTCETPGCAFEGRTLSDWQFYEDGETLRREVVLNWTFERCLSRPCAVTLSTALTLLMVESHQFDRVNAEKAQAFRNVCQDADLLAALERLVRSYPSAA